MFMNAKLTLSLDRDIIEQAKEFARSQHKSLSKLIEKPQLKIILIATLD
jgi:hypothetical protein